jgi:methylated-DNA-[protein]-cysteine S-methyltransferase
LQIDRDMTTYGYFDSPIGRLLLAQDGAGLCQLTFEQHKHPRPVQADWQRDDGAFAETDRQLEAYFAGTRRAFDLPLALHGTDFQKRVWQALLHVRYGRTTTYAALAQVIGRAGAYHAVGAAVGMNPISIIVPCHRVLGSNGSLTGYAGGIERKARLLALEGLLLA